MKKILVILFCFNFYNCIGQSLKQLDDKNGFRGFIMGDSLEKFSKIVKLDEKTGSFRVKGKPIKIKNYEVLKTFLRFKENKLNSISMYFIGNENTNNIHQALIDVYGRGNEVIKENHLRHIEWIGKRIKATLIVDVTTMGSLYGSLIFDQLSDDDKTPSSSSPYSEL